MEYPPGFRRLAAGLLRARRISAAVRRGWRRPSRGALGTCCLALLLSAEQASSQGAQRITEEGRQEVLWLDRFCAAENWYPVEECRTTASDLKCPWAVRAMQLTFEVDHHDGEKAYPIGWPRAHLNPGGWERNWRDWDRLEFMALARTSRAELPASALTLEVGEAKPTHPSTLAFPELDKWVPVAISVADVFATSPTLKGGIPRLRFVVSESNYEHEDVVEFHIGGFRLTRSLACEVTALSAATPVIYAGQPYIKLDLTVVGPPADVKRGVPFTIRRGTRVVRQEMLPLGRGKQRFECDVSELALTPGDYELSVFAADKARRRSVPLRVVEEPWKRQ